MAAESPSASSPAPGADPLEPFDPSLDHFARLGLERGWSLGRDALEDRYHARSRVVHPDRFAGADSGTRRAAVEHSAAVNDAYRVLRDPVLRAEYLVKLGGVDLDSSDPKTGAPHPSQALLIEMIERRERLDEVREAGVDALDELRDGVEGEVEGVFARAVESLAKPDITAAAASLVHRRYLQRFLDEIDAAADAIS